MTTDITTNEQDQQIAVQGNHNPFDDMMIRKSANTRTRYIHEVRRFSKFTRRNLFTPANWKGVTADDIRKYQQTMLDVGMSVNTVNQTIFIIRSFGAYSSAYDGMEQTEVFRASQVAKSYRAIEARNIDQEREKDGKATRASNKKESAVIISKYQAEQLKHDHPDDPRGHRDALLMCLLLDFGLRVGDVASLTFGQVDMVNRMVRVTTQKTDTPLTLSMTEDIYNAFSVYLREYTLSDPSASIWYGVNKYGQIQNGFSKHAMQMRVRELGEAIGLFSLSPHDCRHYFVTSADRGGSSLLAITEAGGWKSPAMPARYVNKNAVSNSGIKLG